MTRPADYIAAYDLAEDRERNRVAAVLEGFGFRVQKSVFELRLTRGQREEVLSKLAALKLETGFVSLYRWDSTARRFDVGHAPDRPHDESLHAYVL
jgi:CRISPR-associated protein Cas2